MQHRQKNNARKVMEHKISGNKKYESNAGDGKHQVTVSHPHFPLLPILLLVFDFFPMFQLYT